MAQEQAQVQIVISGNAQSLHAALGQATQALHQLEGASGAASAAVGQKLANAQSRAGHEASTLAARVRVAADALGFLGVESGESALKVFLLRDALKEMHEAFGGLRGAIVGGLGAGLVFGGLDFLKESVKDAMDSQGAWDQLTAAYGRNKEGLEAAHSTIERNQALWERLGITQGQVAAIALRAKTAGMDVSAVLGDPARLADVAAVLGQQIPQALDTIATPRGAQSVLKRLGLSADQIREATAQMRNMTAQQRVLFLEQEVAQHGGAGRGLAQAGTAAGSFAAFHAAISDLREEVGTALLPTLTMLAQGMTHLLQGIEAMTKPFGGLANVLKVVFLPLLILGLRLFLGLHGTFKTLVDLMMGQLKGGFIATGMSMADADSQARSLATDIEAIPTEWMTVAVFIPATAIKDAYKANIFSIPTVWTTTGEFLPADVTAPVTEMVRTAEQVVDATPLVIPTEVGALSEAEIAGAVAAAAADVRDLGKPIELPAALALPAPDDLAALLDPWKTAVEQKAHVMATVAVDQSSAAQSALVGEARTMINKAQRQLGSTEAFTVRANLLVPKLHATGLVVDKVIYTGKPLAAIKVQGGIPIEPTLAPDAPRRYTQIKNAVARGIGRASYIIDAVDHVSTALPAIYTKAQTFMRAHPLSWVLHGAGTGAAFAGSFTLVGAVFQNAKFNQPDMKVPPAQFTTTDAAQLAALRKRLDQPLSVKISGGTLNLGGLGGALVGVNLSATDRQQVKQQISHLESIQRAAERYNEALKHPLLVQLAPLSLSALAGQMAQAVAEVALGTIIANIVTKFMDPGKLLAWLRGLFSGRGGRGPGGGNILQFPGSGSSPESKAINDLMSAIPTSASGSIPVITGAADAGGAVVSAIVTAIKASAGAIGTALKGTWGVVLAGGGLIASIGLAFGRFFLAVLGFIGKMIFGAPELAGAETVSEAQRSGLTKKQAQDYVKNLNKDMLSAHRSATSSFGQFAASILSGIGDGLKRGATALGNIFIDLFNKIIAVIHNIPGFGGLKPIPRLGTSPSSTTALHGGFQALVTPFPGGPAASRPTAMTNHITINGATDPHKVAQEIERALEQFMAGVRSQRRLVG